MANKIDEVINKCVADIWTQYDTDGNGTLDKNETKEFVKKTLGEMDSNDDFSDEDFNACFAEFDKDGNGTIDKAEMALFIKKVAGL